MAKDKQDKRKSSAAQSSMAWKIYSTVLTVGAGIAGRKLLAVAWKLVVRKKPPADPGHPGVSLREATAWAAVSGASAGLARLGGTRKAAAWWTKASGELPPGYEELE
jgi:hypothetical protein